MYVTIVNPPSRTRVYGPLSDLAAIEPPVWAGLLAARLWHKGHDVKILDCEAEQMSPEQAAKVLNQDHPNLAVFTVYGQQPSASTQCLPAAEAVARLCNIRTLCLGTHPSALPAQTLREGPWTYVCKGEGVHTVMDLLSALDGMGQIREVPGLYWREGTAIYHNPPPPNIEALDVELGDRGFDWFDFTKYRAHNWHAFGFPSRSPYASLQTSLSCPFKCHFCCIASPFGGPGQGYRLWSAKNVVMWFEELADRGVKHVKIPDEMFLLNSRHVEAICDGLYDVFDDDPQFNIWAYARVDTCKNDALLEKMKRVGFNWLGIGIESGSQHVRDGVEKGRFGYADIVENIRRVQSHGINVGANYIFGLPDEKLEDLNATLELAVHLNTEWANFYCAMAYPGSRLYEDAKERGWLLPDRNNGPGWIGYSQHAYETLPLPTEHLSASEVLAFRDEAFIKYFTRPEYLGLVQTKFGDSAVKDVARMLSYGKPQRKLLEEATAYAQRA